MKKGLLLFITIFSIQLVVSAQTDTLNPDKDNTLYESASGDISNGAGDYLFFGRTNNGDLRRALIHFDIASIVQPGDSITDVVLKFNVSKVPNTTSRLTTVHSVQIDWGEGSSNAGGEEGTGTAAVNGDATWTQAFFGGTNPIPWANPGGDYVAAASGSVNVTGLGEYSVSGLQMLADVQNWADNPSNNNGWIIIGDETANASAKRINSRENSSNPVSLEISYVSTVSLNAEKLKESVSVFPNPVSKQFEITNSESLESIEILDLNGRIKKVLNPQMDSHNVSDLDRGIYLLRMQLGNKTITQKLIKQ